MARNVLFGEEVFWYGVDEGGSQESSHSEEHEYSVVPEVGVPVHGETPEWWGYYLTKEYLWKRKPMLDTMMWLT